MATIAKRRPITTVLLTGSRRPLTREEVVERGVDRLERLMAETCLWPGRVGHEWRVGDFAFLVLEFDRVKGTPLSVQVWSEAGEPVGVEVVSGHRSPSAKRFIGRRERRALGKLGFTIGGGARNFRKIASMQTPDDARELTRSFLEIVYDVLGYRGRQKLVVKQGWGERARHEPVYDSLTPMDFLKLVGPFDYEGRLQEGLAEPWGMLRHHPTRVTSMMRFMWKVPDSEELFASVRLMSVMPRVAGGRRPTFADLNAINDSVRFVRLSVDEDGDLMLSMDVRFDGGVTATYIGRCLGMWEQARRFVHKRLHKLAAEPTRDRGAFVEERAAESSLGGDSDDDGIEGDEVEADPGRGADDEGSGPDGKSRAQARARGRGPLVVH